MERRSLKEGGKSRCGGDSRIELVGVLGERIDMVLK
jgi:hypothetical protein